MAHLGLNRRSKSIRHDNHMRKSSYGRAVALASVVILVTSIAMIVFENAISGVTPGLYLKDGVLTEAQKQSLSAMLDLVKLLMNWAVAAIGAAAFFLKLGVEKNVPIRKRDLILTFCIILLSVISLFLGHLVIDKSSAILALDQSPVGNDRVRLLGRYQYLFCLSAIILFGFHTFQFFWARNEGD